MDVRRILLVGAAMLASFAAHAVPHIPDKDAQVLERARLAAGDPLARELKVLRQALAQSPANLQLALRLAQRYVGAARASADPRYLGHAEAVLAPWASLPAPPAPVLLMRATLRQSTHDFDGALADLGRALAADPMSAQGWLTLATVQNVQARYRDAAQSCARLAALADELVTVACLAEVGSIAGQAREAYQALSDTHARHGVLDRANEAWVSTLLGEMAARMGRAAEADRHFRAALQAAGPSGDAYLKGAYADFLLDAGRAREVVNLLAGEAAADPLLLRLALAEQALGLDVREHVAMLRSRFAAARMRGDTVHRREESRFMLQLAQEPVAALALAVANWQVQREPADARVLLEAARASGNPVAAQPALAWLRGNHVEDVQLQKIAGANLFATVALAR
jgi:tetratricopeptide (TPR) repeat protein